MLKSTLTATEEPSWSTESAKHCQRMNTHDPYT